MVHTALDVSAGKDGGVGIGQTGTYYSKSERALSMSTGDVARRQILSEYEQGIRELEHSKDLGVPDTCSFGDTVARNMLLMLRFHKLQLEESLSASSSVRRFKESLKLAALVAGMTVLLNPTMWGIIRGLLRKVI